MHAAILAALAIAQASVVRADDGDYLRPLAPFDAIVMVMKDLQVSGAVAQDIVIAANIHLGC